MRALFVINAAFNTGQIVATRGVFDLACENPDFAEFIQKSLNRHVKGDWGDVTEEDKQTNDQALKGDTKSESYRAKTLIFLPFTHESRLSDF